MTTLLTKRVRVVPFRDLRVSSGTGSDALVNYQALETYWESDLAQQHGAPHWLEFNLPHHADWEEVQIYVGDATAYSPERVMVLASYGEGPLKEIKLMYAWTARQNMPITFLSLI